MVTNVVIEFGLNENCGRNSTLKIIAACGPAYRIFQNAIIFGRLPKKVTACDSLYDYDTLYKVWMNRMKIGRGTEF